MRQEGKKTKKKAERGRRYVMSSGKERQVLREKPRLPDKTSKKNILATQQIPSHPQFLH